MCKQKLESNKDILLKLTEIKFILREINYLRRNFIESLNIYVTLIRYVLNDYRFQQKLEDILDIKICDQFHKVLVKIREYYGRHLDIRIL